MINRLIELMRACSLDKAEVAMIPSDAAPCSEIEHASVPADQATSKVGAEIDFRIYCGGCC